MRNVSSLEVNALELADRWWVPVLRGAAAILFGVIAIVAPGLGLLALIALFGAYALVDGGLNLVHAVRSRREGRPWGWFVFAGIIGLVAAAITLFSPRITAMALLLVIAAWAVIEGVLAIAAAIRLRKEIRGEWLLALSGVLSVAFGLLLFMFPAAGALAVVIWIAAYAIILGSLLVALGFRLRSWARGGERGQIPGARAPASV